MAEADRLLSIPVNVNMHDARDVSALMVAAYRGFAAQSQRIIELGADPLYRMPDRIGDDEHAAEISVEDRAAMSHDDATIKVIGIAATKARLALWREDPVHSFDPWFLLRESARFGMIRECVEILDGHVSMAGEVNAEDAEKVLGAAWQSRDLRTYQVLVAMGVDIGALYRDELLPRPFLDALQDAAVHVTEVWATQDRREERQAKL